MPLRIAKNLQRDIKKKTIPITFTPFFGESVKLSRSHFRLWLDFGLMVGHTSTCPAAADFALQKSPQRALARLGVSVGSKKMDMAFFLGGKLK